MESKSGVLVTFNSVIKGYHVYKTRMNASFTYRCEPDTENCYYKNAVVVKCIETQNTIGHVPAVPVKLNHAVHHILQLDSSVKVTW